MGTYETVLASQSSILKPACLLASTRIVGADAMADLHVGAPTRITCVHVYMYIHIAVELYSIKIPAPFSRSSYFVPR